MAAEPVVLALRAGALRLALRPDLGGCIAGLWLGELPVLHSTEPLALTSARPSGCFPLAPYSNRLGFCRFGWRGQAHTTLPNSGESPHAMHGVAWQQAWQVLSAGPDSAELGCRHTADAAWPFDFELRQQVALRDHALALRLQLRNTGTSPQPVGLGWHPYFAKRTGSRLRLVVDARWESDADGLPTHRVAQPAIDAEVSQLALDHCFEGWPGEAVVGDELLRMRLSSSLSRVVVFTPADKPFYCVEPVSHVNNAINLVDPLAHGLRELAPGDQAEAWMTLEVRAA